MSQILANQGKSPVLIDDDVKNPQVAPVPDAPAPDKDFYIFVSDSKLSVGIKDTLQIYSPILTFNKANYDLYQNRSVAFLKEKGYKSLWLVNDSPQANMWLSIALSKHREDITVIAVYTKRKNQKFITDTQPDLVVKKSKLSELAVLSFEELMEKLEGTSVGNRIAQSASMCERVFNLGKRINKKKDPKV